jgi:hypothetical protein
MPCVRGGKLDGGLVVVLMMFPFSIIAFVGLALGDTDNFSGL